MTDLNELISFLPDDWEDSFEIKEDNPIVSKMLRQILVEAIKTVPVLSSELDSAYKEIAGLFRELNHVKERKLEAYEKGISEALDRLVDVEVRTPTARDALLEASARIHELLVQEGHSDQETP